MQTNKILRWIVLGGIFILPFIFFWNPSSMFFPFITGKNFAFRIIVEIIATLAAILALLDAKYRPKATPVFYAYLAFLAILIVADLSGLDPARSFWSNSERMDGLITQLHLFLYFIVACAFLNSEDLWEAFLKTSIGASVIMAFFGLSQLLSNAGAIRIDGKFGNATYLAVYLLFHVFLILYMLAKHWKESAYRWLLIPALVFEAMILYFTATRGDILGLGFGLILSAALIAIFGREQKTLRKISVGIIAAVAVVVVGFLAIRNTDFVRKNEVLNRFASMSATDDTTKARLMVWGMALQGFEERPILGWGQENFNLVFSKYYNPGMYGQEPWFDRAHNVFFDWLVSGGILGLLGYLALFGIGVWTLFRNPRFALAEKAILTGLFAGYFFQNLFVFDNIGSYFMFFTLLAFVAYGSEIGKKPDSAPAAKNAKKLPAPANILDANIGLVQILIIAVSVAGIAAVYFLNVPQIEANQLLIQALQTGSLSDFQTAISYGTFANSEIREQLASAAESSISSKDLTDDQKLAYVNAAISEMKKQIDETPYDVRTKFLAGSLLATVGAPDAALEVLNAAHEQAPKKQQILFAIAESYLQKKDYADALAAAKTAYYLAPQYSEAATIYATVAILDGKQGEADAVFKANPDLETTDDSVLQAYADSNQYAKVASIWKVRFSKDPNNPDLHVSYASTLAGFGDKQAAIAELRTAIRIEQAAGNDASSTAAYIKSVEDAISQVELGKN